MVVGAGPSGSSAAYHLARQGVDVLLVDKATFPREKVCGDGLTPRGVTALQRMGVDPEDPGFTPVEALRTYGTDGTVITLRWPDTKSFPPLGVVRTRFDLDDLLVNRAIKAGARFREGMEVSRPLDDRGWVSGAEVTEGGDVGRVRARYVVAADGASSRFAARRGVSRIEGRPVAAAARRYYRSPRPQEPVLESFLSLQERSGLLAGYGWVFPVGDGLYNVGVGVLRSPKHSKEVTARKVMARFVRQLPPEWRMDESNAVGPLLSGPIPMGINRHPLAVPGMLVVGDAGGIVNPFNGEGIAYAIESGELAAELIGDALARNRPAIAHMYPSLIRERYERYFLIGRNWLKLLGNPTFMRFAVKHGIPRERLMRFALRFMANLSDGRGGSRQDKLMHVILSLAPER
ncbi:MAG: geranylgeranyl reductase family protein [Actinobacteria bacterium]|nr:geranylgeranyl reductase family protein [Actinomycetota bacterium]